MRNYTPEISVIVPVYNVEKYIRNMMESVRVQTFSDFEVLIINDGSPDNSQEIIDEFCARDSRFRSYYKENGGVASARNYGLDLARGRYVVFYDPDDYIPPKSLEYMHAVAEKNDAEIVQGVIVEDNLGTKTIYLNTQKLAQTKNIKPTDSRFYNTWSLCCKMFSRKLIEEHNVRFEILKTAEDGVFLFKLLRHATRIFGCNKIVYIYLKRPFWEGSSATQIVTKQYLEDVLCSQKRILEEATAIAEKYCAPENVAEQLAPLFARFIQIEIIERYYRGTWLLNEDISEELREKLEYYKSRTSEEEWNKLVRKNSDIDLKNGIQSRACFLENPKLSIILSEEIDSDQLNLQLGSIYNQFFPMYEVLTTEANGSKIEDSFRDKANLHFFNDAEELKKNIKGKYILYLDKELLLSKRTLKKAVDLFEKHPDADCIRMLIKSFDGTSACDIPSMNVAVGYSKKPHLVKKDSLPDDFMANKIIRKELFDINRYADFLNGRSLLQSMWMIDCRKDYMITMLGQEVFDGTVNMSKMSNKVKNIANNSIDMGIETIKRFITREDIDNLTQFVKNFKNLHLEADITGKKKR